jgi:hypothetical protein
MNPTEHAIRSGVSQPSVNRRQQLAGFRAPPVVAG